MMLEAFSQKVQRMDLVVGISEMKVSNIASEALITYSLGSCIGVAIYDPDAKVAGLIHCMLPLSKIDTEKAKTVPCMFVDTGIPLMFKKAYRLGAKKENIIVKLAGCASIMDDKGLFKIGERNYTVCRKILWKNSILIDKMDIGGNNSRTISVEVATGRVVIKSCGKEVEL